METGLLFSITDEEFDLIRRLVYDHLGIHLTSAKRTLLAGRLQFFLTEKGYPNFLAYYHGVLRDASGRELSELADRITTNHTYFNRENDHFDFFSKVALPELTSKKIRQGAKSLSVWCAACSTGEEAYMLVMLMMEFLGVDYPHWDAGVLATDISNKALGEAESGIYSEERMEKLPAALRTRYFKKLPTGDYQAQPRIRREITFRRLNLINPEFPLRSGFDMIFCRNVMIYFDGPTKAALIGNMFRYTNPGGYFFIGHSESLDRKICPYRFVRPSVYVKDA